MKGLGMYCPATRNETVVPIELGITLDVGAPYPTLVSSDWSTVLLVRLSEDDPSGHLTGIITWTDCFEAYMGWPNEEDFDRHPLYEYGLQGVLYAAGEVLNSSWVASIAHLPPITAEAPARHFIMPFNDATFECVAKGCIVATDPRSMALVFAEQFPWPKST